MSIYIYLGQKSLFLLHKVDTVQTWTSLIYDKHFKWLSYNLWFSYVQFYKIAFFINFFIKIPKINYLYPKNTFLINNINNNYKLNNNNVRFSYYVDLYCIEFNNYLLLVNLYFYTNLKYLNVKDEQIKTLQNEQSELYFNNNLFFF